MFTCLRQYPKSDKVESVACGEKCDAQKSVKYVVLSTGPSRYLCLGLAWAIKKVCGYHQGTFRALWGTQNLMVGNSYGRGINRSDNRQWDIWTIRSRGSTNSSRFAVCVDSRGRGYNLVQSALNRPRLVVVWGRHCQSVMFASTNEII